MAWATWADRNEKARGAEWGNETKSNKGGSIIGTEYESTGSNRYKKAMREGTMTELIRWRVFEVKNKAQPLALDSTFPESTGKFIHIQARCKPQVTIREQTYAQEDNKTKGTDST